MAQPALSAEQEQFLAFVRALRAEGATRVRDGQREAYFALPLDEHGTPAAVAEPLTSVERRRYDRLRERYERDEELGNA